MTSSSDSIQTENVVASSAVDQELDLESVARDLPRSQYDPDQFPGLVYRTQEPKASVLVFRSGKIVTTGATSKAEIREVLNQLYADLDDLGIDTPEEPSPNVQNMVSSADIGEQLNLNAIAIGLGLEDIEYEPEQFPGLVYRLDDPDVVVLLFGSGKLVITGATQPEDAPEAVSDVRSKLHELDLLG